MKPVPLLLLLLLQILRKSDAQVEDVELDQGSGPCRQGLIICTAHCESFYSDSLISARCLQRDEEEEKKRCICTVQEEYCDEREHEEECEERTLTTANAKSSTFKGTTKEASESSRTTTALISSTSNAETGSSSFGTTDSETMSTTDRTDSFTSEGSTGGTSGSFSGTTDSSTETDTTDSTKTSHGLSTKGSQDGDDDESEYDEVSTTQPRSTKRESRRHRKRKDRRREASSDEDESDDDEDSSDDSTTPADIRSSRKKGGGKQTQKQNQSINLAGGKPRGGIQINASQKQKQRQGGGDDSDSGDGGDQIQKQDQSVKINLEDDDSDDDDDDDDEDSEQTTEDKQDCQVSEWTAWLPCSKPCDGGEQSRMRVISRAAKGGGKPCPSMIETRKCNKQRCPVDCQVTEWTEIAPCSKSCGGGYLTEIRAVKVNAQGIGRPCPKLVRKSPCNERSCESESAAEQDVDCEVSDWKRFGECSQTCGRGVQTLVRTVLREQRGDGDECPKLQKTERCNEGECREECKHEEWSSWFECSVTCGKGITIRTRMVSRGGRSCKPQTERQPCHLRPCDPTISADCQVLPWGRWSECNVPCGGGVQARTRIVIQQPTNEGRLCPDLYETRACNKYSCESSESRRVKPYKKCRRRHRHKHSKSGSGRRHRHKHSKSGGKSRGKGKGKHHRSRGSSSRSGSYEC